MSIQFGSWNFYGNPVSRDYIGKIQSTIEHYGPDCHGCYNNDNVCILYRAFHTTEESRRETQPHICSSGIVITWDGRLDNRTELIGQLRNLLALAPTDLEIVAAAYELWGTNCFAKLLGDWALAIWQPKDHSVILAKDFVGTRHIFYSIDDGQVAWSTVLDPLVLHGKKPFSLNQEYVAGWLRSFPEAHLTPYHGIHSVPPSSYVTIEPHRQATKKYWDFDPHKRVRYSSDAEYEEHFRAIFRDSIRRRLRADSPILAELSGGMDSSSIVCMADAAMLCEPNETPRIDTISYYSECEPDWNELPFLVTVEEKRGRSGCHVDVGPEGLFEFSFRGDNFGVTPGFGEPKPACQTVEHMMSQGHRVVLSGIGGDEFLGGVPTSTPELCDLLVRGNLRTLAHQLKMWALDRRKPWVELFFDCLKSFCPPSLAGTPEQWRPASWLRPQFVSRNRNALTGYPRRLRVLGPLPSFQENLNTLEKIRRQLSWASLSSKWPYEKRYPYLDREFLETLYAMPRDQIVRPGQRRSLMRRALAGIVPEAVLTRRRKAFISRAPRIALSGWKSVVDPNQLMLSALLMVVDPERLNEAVSMAQQGKPVSMSSLMRTLALEHWLQQATNRNVLGQSGPDSSRASARPRPSTERASGLAG